MHRQQGAATDIQGRRGRGTEGATPLLFYPGTACHATWPESTHRRSPLTTPSAPHFPARAATAQRGAARSQRCDAARALRIEGTDDHSDSHAHTIRNQRHPSGRNGMRGGRRAGGRARLGHRRHSGRTPGRRSSRRWALDVASLREAERATPRRDCRERDAIRPATSERGRARDATGSHACSGVIVACQRAAAAADWDA